MNSLPLPALTPAPEAPDSEPPSRDLHGQSRDMLRQQLEHRFRHSLRSGQLSPLLHLVMRYKLENGT